jgi:hypothetical protein
MTRLFVDIERRSRTAVRMESKAIETGDIDYERGIGRKG